MNKIKLKERFENAFNAFFDEGTSTENNSLTLRSESGLLQNQMSETFFEKGDILVKALKQIFLFFPATFILFIISFAFTVIAINNPINAILPEGRMFWLALWFLVACFMTWFGLGDLRKPKYLAIPASIIGTGFIVGVFSGILSIISHQLQVLIFSDAYPLYFFSLALIVPFLAKGWVDKKWEDSD